MRLVTPSVPVMLTLPLIVPPAAEKYDSSRHVLPSSKNRR